VDCNQNRTKMPTTHLDYSWGPLPPTWEGVVKQYIDAVRENILSMQIATCRVSVLPGWVTELRSLKKLSLSGSDLYTLPDELANLTQLEELTLLNTKFIELPPVVTRLHSLKRFEIYGYTPYTLPIELANLAQLEVLALAYNKLSELPRVVTQMRSLKILSLGCNELRTLPDELANLTQLELLHVTDNQLTELPPVVTRMRSLKQLLLMGCKLRTLPDEFANLTQLEVLDVTDNKFTELPPVLGSLPRLHRVGGYDSLDITDVRRRWQQPKARMNMRARAFHVAIVAAAHNPAAAVVAQRRLPAHVAAELIA
jgi:Leucine-rich repeat (LRR) protein